MSTQAADIIRREIAAHLEAVARLERDLAEIEQAAPAAPVDVEAAIRAIVRRNMPERGAWVALATVRRELPRHLDRATVDTAFKTLAHAHGVHIIPVANLKSLTAEDRAAEFWMGGEPNHAITIEY